MFPALCLYPRRESKEKQTDNVIFRTNVSSLLFYGNESELYVSNLLTTPYLIQLCLQVYEPKSEEGNSRLLSLIVTDSTYRNLYILIHCS